MQSEDRVLAGVSGKPTPQLGHLHSNKSSSVTIELMDLVGTQDNNQVL